MVAMELLIPGAVEVVEVLLMIVVEVLISHMATGGNGGSGFVVIKFPDSRTITIGGGLTRAIINLWWLYYSSISAGTDTISFS